MVTKWQQEIYEKTVNKRLSFFHFLKQKTAERKILSAVFSIFFYASIPRLVRYFLTISATLKVMASSNSRRSRPVSFLIFSRR